MSLSSRRWKTAAAKGRTRRRNAAREHRLAESKFGRCLMQTPDGIRCTRTADRPGGYCRPCWDAAKQGERTT